MSARKIILWVLFLVVAASLWFLSDAVDRRSQEHERETNRLVSLKAPLEVVSVDIQGKDIPKPILIKRQVKQYGWEMLKPVAYPADSMQVGRLISSVLEGQRTGVIEKPGDLKQFGLDPPAIKVTLTDKEGDQAVLLVGNLSPTKEFAYAAVPASKEVWLVPPTLRGAVNRSVFELRDKMVLDFPVNKVTGLELELEGKTLKLSRVKKGDQPLWRLADGSEADAASVEDALFMVHGLMAVDFLDQGIFPEKMGLTQPWGRVRLSLEGDKATGLVIGKQVAGRSERYVRRLSGGPVMVVKQASLQRLAKVSRFSLLQRRVMRFHRDEAVALSVTRDGVDLKFAKQEGVWQRTQPPGDEKSGEAASLLVWDLGNLKWQKLLTGDGPWGLDKPSAVINLTIKPPAGKDGREAEERVITLRLGRLDKASKLLPAQVKGDKRVFGLAADLADSLPKPPSDEATAPKGPK